MTLKPLSQPSEPAETPAVRVLLVDDQESFRAAARLVIEMTDGFEIVGEAVDGEQALELVERVEPQLVLMDIKLPGIDGIEVTRRLQGLRPALRVIALSTYDEYEQQARDAGAVAFLPKSAFGPEKIVEMWSQKG